MTTIIVTHEDNEMDEFAFDANDRVISIGRRSTNDVCIPNLSVSGVHARVTVDGDSALLEDNSSTNGTYVNGRLISRQLLHENDEIVIGKTRVVVQLASIDYVNEVAQSKDAAKQPPTLNTHSRDVDLDDVDLSEAELSAADLSADLDDSFNGAEYGVESLDQSSEQPMSLSEKAKLALGRQNGPSNAAPQRSGMNGVAATAMSGASAAASRAFENEDSDVAIAEAPTTTFSEEEPHPLEGLDDSVSERASSAISGEASINSSTPVSKPAGAVIEIQNGAKSGQVLPIDKPVTTLGRPGIQIAAIMRKPDGYFLMHIESDDSVDMPTLNRDTIGDDPVMLHSGDRLNVAGIDVEFMLS